MRGSESAGGRTARRWDPEQYLRFGDQRLRPALELLARVRLETPRLIYDLGCGTGKPTRMLAERWPGAEVHGVDSSDAMLAKAEAGGGPIHWDRADIREWHPGASADLIYSNATLHWVEGHQELFPRLLDGLAPGGCLAVQMPLSWEMPSHRLMREVLDDGAAGGGAFATEALRRSVGRRWVDSTASYYELLAPVCTTIDIWETEYLQILEGEDPVLEWVKGTGLRPVLEGLPDAEREQFLEVYGARLRQAYPRRDDGRTLYPFRRLFIVATL